MTGRDEDSFASQRYEPLPGLLGLPGFVWKRLPRGARIAVVAAAGLMVAGTAVALPIITAGKREAARVEHRADAARRVREAARLRRDQALHRGRVAAGSSRAQLRAAVERAVESDARARQRRGLLPGPPVDATRCAASADLAGAQGRLRAHGGGLLKCLAATSQGTAPGGTRFAIGFEFIAAVDYRRDRFNWCKTNPLPGEGFAGAGLDVPMDPACFDPRR